MEAWLPIHSVFPSWRTSRLVVQSTNCRFVQQVQHKKVLDLYAKPEHRQISQLIQCITYLVPEFAKRQSGPDWIAERDMNLVRETWVYMYLISH